MNNKNKIWESKKKLLEKLKNERTRYVAKHNAYVRQKESDIKAHNSVVESPWTKYIAECDRKIKYVENSGSFKNAKKIAKGRKG